MKKSILAGFVVLALLSAILIFFPNVLTPVCLYVNHPFIVVASWVLDMTNYSDVWKRGYAAIIIGSITGIIVYSLIVAAVIRAFTILRTREKVFGVNWRAMLVKADSWFRNRWFWLGLLLATYFLPALLANIPMALAWPWMLIPHVHEGMYESLRQCGMPSFYGNTSLLFAIVFQAIFWPLCCLLVVWGKRLPSPILRIAAVVLLILIVVTIYGCSIAIDAVRH